MEHQEYQLESGRPASTAERAEKEIRVYDLLDNLQIPYMRIDHSAANTMEACRMIDESLGATICKNIFLCNRQETEFYLLMMEGNKIFKTRYLSQQLGCSRLSFAPPAYMEQFLDIQPGAVSVMGLMNDRDRRVQLVMDRPIAESLEVGCHPCVSTTSLKLKTKDILERFLPAVGHEPVVVDLPDVGAEGVYGV